MFENTRSEIDRREFGVRASIAVLGGAVITLTACGGEASPVSPTPQPGDEVGTVSANHGHAATITAAQLTDGGGLSLDIRGQANHSHTVELSADEVRRVREGERLAKESSTESAHRHTVTFN